MLRRADDEPSELAQLTASAAAETTRRPTTRSDVDDVHVDDVIELLSTTFESPPVGVIDVDLDHVRAPVPPADDDEPGPLLDERGELTDEGEAFLGDAHSFHAIENGGDFDGGMAEAWSELR